MSKCVVMMKAATVEEVFAHEQEQCEVCSQQIILSVTNGSELLWTNSTPQFTVIRAKQLAEAIGENTEEEEQPKDEKVSARKRKMPERAKKINTQPISQEEAMDILRGLASEMSDAQLQNEARKLLHTNKLKATEAVVSIRREEGLKRKKELEATKQAGEKDEDKERGEDDEASSSNAKAADSLASPSKGTAGQKQEKPWQPRELLLAAIGKFSSLSVIQQDRLSSMLTNLLTPNPVFRHSLNKDEFRNLSRMAEEERVEWAQLIFSSFVSPNLKRYSCIFSMDASFVLTRMRGRFMKDRRRFSLLRNISWMAEPAGACPEGARPKLERVVVSANPLSFIKTREPFIFVFQCYLSTLEMPDKTKKVVLEATLKQRFAPALSGAHDIRSDEQLMSLCAEHAVSVAMDATTVAHLMTAPSFPRNYSYVIPISVVNKTHAGSMARVCILGKPRPYGPISAAFFHDHGGKLAVTSTFIQPPKTKKPRAQKPQLLSAPSTSTSTSSAGDDVLDKVMGAGVQWDAPSTDSSHRYAVYKVGASQQRFFVRSSPSGSCSSESTHYVTSKVEYFPEAGCLTESVEQQLFTHLKAIFKGASLVTKFFLHYCELDCVQISSTRLLGSEGHVMPQRLTNLLNWRSERLSSLLSDLSTLEVGDFALRVESGESQSISLLCLDADGSVQMDKLERTLTTDTAVPSANDAFHGFDSNTLLHWQTMQRRVPCTLWPQGHRSLSNKFFTRGRAAGKGGAARKNRKKSKGKAAKTDAVGDP